MGTLMDKNKLRMAQAMIEYAVLFAILAGSLVAMQIYVKRAMQGRFRESADTIGTQYAPKSAASAYTTTINPSVTSTNSTLVWLRNASGQPLLEPDTGLPVFGIETNTTYSETTTKSGSENMGVFESDLYD